MLILLTLGVVSRGRLACGGNASFSVSSSSLSLSMIGRRDAFDVFRLRDIFAAKKKINKFHQ